LDQPNVGKLEVIIVNDGSTDSTAEIAATLENRFSAKRPLVRVINKINGGHGSTINVGLEEAKGKYFRVVDGDDTVDSEELSKLIDILEVENSDIVLTNYVEDFAESNTTVIKYPYQNLEPGIMYRFEDLCYPDYGFVKFGPIMSCSCYKTDKLRAANFRLMEKAFYVDMELNTYISIFSSTVTYYDLNVYRYLLGQKNQSVSTASFIRNYKHHENVCFRMLDAYERYFSEISEVRKSYLREQLIFPMLIFQYNLTINIMRSREAFLSFDRRLSKYEEFYQAQKLCSREVNFARSTKGLLLLGK
jgi:glycosyltransferase involved in cell wall biosynthesis